MTDDEILEAAQARLDAKRRVYRQQVAARDHLRRLLRQIEREERCCAEGRRGLAPVHQAVAGRALKGDRR